ncbi:alpha/beta hydrolase [Paraconexibacter antarcticus]|uniref:Alpha/beta hydrolase n=1 Tax=Paraconexibacter antarcticus TaxID=2949664 RepID=A0ABY5DPZ4_9ACTN|nr:alpha/beta hydrolase [Paraconexibacter antarcticus]UTI63694.1 alpha/beta hydrolase [Paraconexibacter antarcticus]
MGSVTLSGGRRLAYTEAGPPDGAPVLVLHGAIGSPLRVGDDLATVLDALAIRYVMVSRPGFGASDPVAGRRMTDLAADLGALADALGLARFGLVGVSAGGPYALATAAVLPERLTAVATVGSPSPAYRPWAAPGMSRRARTALRGIATAPGVTCGAGGAAVALVRRHPGLLLRAMTLGADSADRELLHDPARAEAAVAGFLAATAGGVRGLVDDYLLSARPWGFRLEDVTPEVQLWHGARDTLVPPAHAVALAAALPRHRITFAAGDGHFLFRRRLAAILGPLAASAREPVRA